MFGHDDNNQDQNGATVEPSFTDSTTPVAGDTPATSNNDLTDTSAPASDPSSDTSNDSATETPLLESTGTPDDNSTSATSRDDSNDSFGSTATSSPKDDTSTAGNDDLLDLKKQSLEELAPLVSQLDQTPEEKFKTTMMMIQATDDSSLIKSAHETALQITDEKDRAQALLDIVNEINYFTQVASSKND
jgi:hypothetical protein